MDSIYLVALFVCLTLLIHSIKGEDILITITKEKIGSEEADSTLIEAVLSRHSSKGTSEDVKSASNPEESKPVDPSIGLRTSSKNKHRHQNRDRKRNGSVNKSCCFHGGLCVLGSFCHCRKNFYGRFCEYDKRTQHCGEIKNGEVGRRNCDICRCAHGHLSCLPNVFAGCDEPASNIDSTDKIKIDDGTQNEDRTQPEVEYNNFPSKQQTSSASQLYYLKDFFLLFGCLLISFCKLIHFDV